MVGVPKGCEGFVVIWLCACEEFANNRFQLVFIYRDSDIQPNPIRVRISEKDEEPGLGKTCELLERNIICNKFRLVEFLQFLQQQRSLSQYTRYVAVHLFSIKSHKNRPL